MLNQKQEIVKSILPGAVPARLVNFRSHQASARTYFARFNCLSPRLSAPWFSEDVSGIEVEILMVFTNSAAPSFGSFASRTKTNAVLCNDLK